MLKSLSDDLTKYMLVAFPFMLLPMWLAIRTRTTAIARTVRAHRFPRL